MRAFRSSAPSCGHRDQTMAGEASGLEHLASHRLAGRRDPMPMERYVPQVRPALPSDVLHPTNAAGSYRRSSKYIVVPSAQRAARNPEQAGATVAGARPISFDNALIAPGSVRPKSISRPVVPTSIPWFVKTGVAPGAALPCPEPGLMSGAPVLQAAKTRQPATRTGCSNSCRKKRMRYLGLLLARMRCNVRRCMLRRRAVSLTFRSQSS